MKKKNILVCSNIKDHQHDEYNNEYKKLRKIRTVIKRRDIENVYEKPIKAIRKELSYKYRKLPGMKVHQI